MHPVFKYSLPQLLAAFNECRSRENLSKNSKSILGLSVAVLITLLLISLAFWLVAIILLISKAHLMPTWAVIVGIVLLFIPTFGPLATILIALLVRK